MGSRANPRRGDSAEIVRDGETGFLVEPGSIAGLVAAIGQLSRLDRRVCRQQAEQEFSLAALGDRPEAWFAAILAAPTNPTSRPRP